jgi:Domain of unknown function (DUF5615)
MLWLYMDVHVKAAIPAGLRRRGLDVVTAQEDGGTRLEDVALLERATALQCVLFSQDDDLLAIARARQTMAVVFVGLIYGHQLAATMGKYVLDLEMICQVLNPGDMANRIEYLPLRSVAHVRCPGEVWRGTASRSDVPCMPPRG